MKKFLMLWLPLILTVVGGLGVGFYFLRSPSDQADEAIIQEEVNEPELTVSQIVADLDTTKHLVPILDAELQNTTLTDGLNVVFFAPTQDAIDQFTEKTGLGLESVLQYHLSSSETPTEIKDGTKIVMKNNKQVIIVDKEGKLFVRDAKGNDYPIRNPLKGKNGEMYLIEGVLLPQ